MFLYIVLYILFITLSSKHMVLGTASLFYQKMASSSSLRVFFDAEM